MSMRRLLSVAIIGTLAFSAIAGQKDVIAHIQCAVCKQAVKEASVHAKKNQIDDEDALSDVVENLCSASKDEGKWTTKIDIIAKEAGTRLGLDRRDEEGVCKSECKAVQKACSQALKGREDTLVSQIRDGSGVGKLQKELCKKPCKKELPVLSKWKDEAFIFANVSMPDPPTPPPKKEPDPANEFAPLMHDFLTSALEEFGSTAKTTDIAKCFEWRTGFEEFLKDMKNAVADFLKKELTEMRTGLLAFSQATQTIVEVLHDSCPDSKSSAKQIMLLAKKLEDYCKDNSDAIEYKAMEVLRVGGHDIHKPLNALLGAWKQDPPDGAALGRNLAKFYKALEIVAEGRSDL